MNVKGELLKPDFSKAKIKLTITVTAHIFEDESGFVETKWVSELGTEIKGKHIIGSLDSAKDQIMNEFILKSDQN